MMDFTSALTTVGLKQPRMRVGVVGTGFVAQNFVELARAKCDFLDIRRIYSRRPAEASLWVGVDHHTSSLERMADECDLLLEVSGDVDLATAACLLMSVRGKPVVTLNCEFQATNGSYFVDEMFLSEAHGDQPGNAAALHAEALGMGFTPLAHINYKGFLNHNPTREEMIYWAEKQKLSVSQTVSFTDGTKLQIEQAITANGLGLDIAEEGLIGGARENGLDLSIYGQAAEAHGAPIADYACAKGAPPGVAIVARHDLTTHLMDHVCWARIATPDKRYVVLQSSYHLVHLEIPRLLRTLWETSRPNWRPLLNNGASPRIGVGAVVKRPLARGALIEDGHGGFDVRGVAVRYVERPDHVPVTLLKGARLTRAVEPGDMLTFDDVELPETPGVAVHRKLRARMTEDRPEVVTAG